MTMNKGDIHVRYTIEEFIKYQAANNVLPQGLVEYCLNNNSSKIMIRQDILGDMELINKSVMNDTDPDDILVKTSVMSIMNRISAGNFSELLTKLKKIKYTNIKHLQTLGKELVERVMNDPAMNSNFEPSKTDQFISNVVVKIARLASNLSVPVPGKEEPVAFRSVFLSIVKNQYMDFLNAEKRLDSKNQHRISNYKGFMNFLGLMYVNSLLTENKTLRCLKGIADLIFNKKWGTYEAEIAFAGYEKLLNQVVYGMNNGKNFNVEFYQTVVKITEKIKEKNNKEKRLSRLLMIGHRKMMKKLGEVKMPEKKAEAEVEANTESVTTVAGDETTDETDKVESGDKIVRKNPE